MANMIAGFRLRLAWGFLRSGCPDRRQHLSLHTMLRTIATRRDLAGLEDRILRDIGINRADALVEARRAPWDLAPAHRIRNR